MLQQYVAARHRDFLARPAAASDLARRQCRDGSFAIGVDAWKSLNGRPYMRWTKASVPISNRPQGAQILQVAVAANLLLSSRPPDHGHRGHGEQHRPGLESRLTRQLPLLTPVCGVPPCFVCFCSSPTPSLSRPLLPSWSLALCRVSLLPPPAASAGRLQLTRCSLCRLALLHTCSLLAPVRPDQSSGSCRGRTLTASTAAPEPTGEAA